MRLIDADNAITAILNVRDNELHSGYPRSFEQGAIRKALRCIEETPTIDAVPVVHGRWIAVPITKGIGTCPYFNGNLGDDRHNCVGAPFSCPCKRSSIWGKSNYHCSECGLEVGYSEKSKTNYCPNCGAKMDEED